MCRVIPHPGPSGDDRRDPRQGPQIGGEAVSRRAFQQRGLHSGQLLTVEARLAPRPADGFQPPPTLGLPRVIPPMGCGPGDAQLPRDAPLRRAPAKQPRGLEPPRFQRSKISASSAGRRHALASQSTA